MHCSANTDFIAILQHNIQFCVFKLCGCRQATNKFGKFTMDGNKPKKDKSFHRQILALA